MKLTRTQLNYAQNRLDAAVAKKLEAFKAPPTMPKLTYEEKYRLIKSGEAKLKPFDQLSCSYTDLKDAYDYPDHNKAVEKAAALLKAWEKDRAEYYSKLHAERQAILDKLYLGDAEEAMKLIEAFAK